MNQVGQFKTTEKSDMSIFLEKTETEPIGQNMSMFLEIIPKRNKDSGISEKSDMSASLETVPKKQK